MNKNDLVEVLLSIDEEASFVLDPAKAKPVVVIVGGAAFMLRDLTSRPVTHDVDVLQASRQVREILNAYPHVNGAVATYADQIPYNFEDRLAPLDMGARAITYCTPSTEDMIVMKLYAERPHDLQDMDNAARQGLVDWELLDHLVRASDEAQASALSARRYREMLGAYERFCERIGR